MIIDLEKCHNNIYEEYDICIIGAGLAGLYLSNNIKNKKLSIIELGNFKSTHNNTVDTNNNYDGANFGRHFGVGGTSNIWGGQLYRLSEHDYSCALNNNINLIFESYLEYFKFCNIVESKLFDKKISEYQDKKINIFGNDFYPIFTKWLPFRKRLFKYIDSYRKHLYINSSCVDFEMHDGKISAILIKSKSGNTKKIIAKKFIIACGALESTRLLLLLNKKFNLNKNELLGVGLSDHLSVVFGKVTYLKFKHRLLFLNRFKNGIMRSVRYEHQINGINKSVFSAYVHFIELNEQFSIVDILKWALKISNSISKKISLILLFNAFMDFFLLIYYRMIKKVLFLGIRSETLVSIDITQQKNIFNKISLSEKKDFFDINKINIDWSVKSDDIKNIKCVIEKFKKAYQDLPNKKFEINFYDEPKFVKNIYHAYGTTILGDTKSNSVIDQNFLVRGTNNLFCVSTSIFSNIGCANPTLTQLACIEKFLLGIENEYK